jgi:integrase
MKGCPALTPRQVRLALRHLRGRYRWRNRALLILGIRTGLRISEALRLKVGQVWDGTEILARAYVQRECTKGKRNGASLVIHPKAAVALKKWIMSRGPVSAEDWLFPSQVRPNQPLGRHAGWDILHQAFVASGVTGMAGSHCMRKTFAQNVHEALKGDLFRLSKAMRHVSPLSTLSYLSFRQEEIDRAILRA